MMLAGMTPPFYHFEMAALRDRALEELGIAPISRPEALKIYAAEIALDALQGDRDMLAVLKELSRLCIEQDYVADLFDFYLLFNAWEDLLTSVDQWYWPDANRANIAEIARARLETFVDAAHAPRL
jgi:hypothetical protein